MVGSTGAGEMLPMLAITPGQTQGALKKFANGNEKFSMYDGGCKENDKHTKRHVLKGGKGGQS